MTWLLMILISGLVHAENLEVVELRYRAPAEAPSCGLLRHREIERAKVIRELIYLKGKEIFRANHLLTNKLFMPDESWRDLGAEVSVLVRVPEGLRAEILAGGGLGQVFLSVDAPGFVWQSFAYQLPSEMTVEQEGEFLRISYLVYLNVLCLEERATPKIEWVPKDQAPNRPNTLDLY